MKLTKIWQYCWIKEKSGTFAKLWERIDRVPSLWNFAIAIAWVSGRDEREKVVFIYDADDLVGAEWLAHVSIDVLPHFIAAKLQLCPFTLFPWGFWFRIKGLVPQVLKFWSAYDLFLLFYIFIQSINLYKINLI